MKSKGLYVHIPFCESICSYCDFCKVYYDQKTVDDYLCRLAKELKHLPQVDFESVYIGGGTPSCLSDDQLYDLLNMLKPYTQHIKEMTIEVNPESMDVYKLKILKAGGVTRLSIGVQTFQDYLLPAISRRHNSQQVKRLIRQGQDLGFSNISIDLMYGLPQQTLDDIKKDLAEVKDLNIQHISYYSLILEDHTVLKNVNYQPIDDQLDYQYNILIDQTLNAYGFDKYEISNYAKTGYQSFHNKLYWQYENYLGVGLSACGKIDNQMLENNRSLTDYLQGKNIQTISTLEKKDVMFNHLMMSLRLVEGLDLNRFYQLYHEDARDVYKEGIEKNIKLGYMICDHDHLYLHKDALYYLNTILLDFL